MLRKLLHIWLAALGCAALLAPSATSGQAPAAKAGTVGKAVPAVESTTGYRGARYSPSDRRDPFLNPLLFRKREDPNEELPRGTPPQGIAGMYISQVELLGMSIGLEEKRAAFRGTDKRVYFLREGDRMFDGFIKSITSDFVQLIRETKLRSGKVLNQEITKRLRTP